MVDRPGADAEVAQSSTRLGLKAISRLSGITRPALALRLRHGEFPPPMGVRPSGRPYWSRAGIERWIEESPLPGCPFCGVKLNGWTSTSCASTRRCPATGAPSTTGTRPWPRRCPARPPRHRTPRRRAGTGAPWTASAIRREVAFAVHVSPQVAHRVLLSWLVVTAAADSPSGQTLRALLPKGTSSPTTRASPPVSAPPSDRSSCTPATRSRP